MILVMLWLEKDIETIVEYNHSNVNKDYIQIRLFISALSKRFNFHRSSIECCLFNKFVRYIVSYYGKPIK